MPRTRLTLAEARRAALAAQGLGRRRPALVGARAVGDVVRRIGAVQIDSVNVLVRAHYLPAFSRLGPYDRALLDRAAGRAPRALFEYWGHEAALLPVSAHPLMRWRMERAHADAWGGMVAVQREQPGLVAEVLAAVAALGPVTATDLEARLAPGRADRGADWGWNWSSVKRAVEFLFWSGEVTAAGRDGSFRRRYAVPEAVLPAEVLATPTPSPEDAQRELVARAAAAMGVATLADLADYFRMPLPATRVAVRTLVDAGELVEVEVPGWPQAFVSPRLRIPRAVRGAALLAPFDPLVWFRPRTERLFGMRYRLEIYTPAAQRVHGYYVLPFLFDDALVARVDLKAERSTGRLLVRAAHGEGVPDPEQVAALARELAGLGAWLDVPEVVVEPVGDLAGRLAAALQDRA